MVERSTPVGALQVWRLWCLFAAIAAPVRPLRSCRQAPWTAASLPAEFLAAASAPRRVRRRSADSAVVCDPRWQREVSAGNLCSPLSAKRPMFHGVCKTRPLARSHLAMPMALRRAAVVRSALLDRSDALQKSLRSFLLFTPFSSTEKRRLGRGPVRCGGGPHLLASSRCVHNDPPHGQDASHTAPWTGATILRRAHPHT